MNIRFSNLLHPIPHCHVDSSVPLFTKVLSIVHPLCYGAAIFHDYIQKVIYKCPQPCYAGNARMTPSNATNAIAFAGNARKKQGRKPLQ